MKIGHGDLDAIRGGRRVMCGQSRRLMGIHNLTSEIWISGACDAGPGMSGDISELHPPAPGDPHNLEELQWKQKLQNLTK